MPEIAPKPKIRANNIFRLLGRYCRAMRLYFYIGLLWCKNLVLFRKLKVQSVFIHDSVVIQGNLINLIWDIKGCYKIKVAGVGVFPGSSHGIRFVFDNNINPLEITFYGTFKNSEQLLYVRSTEIKVLHTFETTTQIPYAHYHFKKISVPDIHISPVHLSLNLPSGEIKLKSVKIMLDGFSMI